MNESKPSSGWNESKPSFPAMNVGEAMAYASKDKCFWTGEMHIALKTLASEVERLRAWNIRWRDVSAKLRLTLAELSEELAAAKAASVLPVGITDLSLCGGGQRIEFYLLGDKSDGAKMLGWLRDRMKERGEG